ncbi:MAG TPA: metallophosphoesterase [Terriglobia bacterium]|nr:metallophosphoesterase [Terriglobia bacterium]
MSEITIVHLSDTHLGHDYIYRSLQHGRLFWKTEDESLLLNLEKALGKIRPNYVVHSGDFVNKATSRNFVKASQRLRSLFANAGIDMKRSLLAIPGNHDVKVLAQEDRYWGRLAGFNHFLKLLFGETDYRSRKQNFVVVDQERKLCFFCLDSTLKHKRGIAEGMIGQSQWDWFKRKYETLMKIYPDFDGFVKVVALHHHPHPIKAGGQEQFMTLLDSGTAIDIFQAYGVNVVLHGHKHFPHILKHHYNGDRHYIVIGAGTATCPFLEEQSGEGNSFNLLRMRLDANLLSIERWKANNDKEYVPVPPAPIMHPLFPTSRSGYRIAESRGTNEIQNTDGTLVATHERLGIIVEPNYPDLTNIAFGVGASAPNAAVTGFEYDQETVQSVDYKVNEKAKKEGYLILRNSIRQGSDPLDLWFTSETTGAICMRRADYQTFYPGNGTNQESVGMLVFHPIDKLTLIVEFPRKYKVKPHPQVIDQNGVEKGVESASSTFLEDRLANRFQLTVRKPLLQHTYKIVWQVPE